MRDNNMDNYQYRLSIIIPYYNEFDRLVACLKSIPNNNADLVEYIIVDDCSKDDLKKKLDFSLFPNLNINVFRNAINSGPGVSRNFGIKQASGEYITFLDSDDQFDTSFFNEIFDYLDGKNELIIFDYLQQNLDKTVQKSIFFNSHIEIKDIATLVSLMRGSSWGRVYKSSLIQEHKIEFLNQKRNEDIPFSKSLCSYVTKFVYVKKPYYHYTENQQSLMHQDHLLDPRNALNSFEYMREHFNTKLDRSVLSCIYLKNVFVSTSLMNLKRMKRKEWIKYVSNLKKDEYFSNKNKYFKNYPLSSKIAFFLIKQRLYYMTKLLYKMFR